MTFRSAAERWIGSTHAARYGAAYSRTAADGSRRTQEVIDETFGSDFDAAVEAGTIDVEGAAVVEVRVTAEVPVLAFWGPTVEVEVSGHAIEELLP